MTAFPLSAILSDSPSVAEPCVTDLDGLVRMLRDQIGLNFDREDVAALQEMVPIESGVQAKKWLKDAATELANRASQAPTFDAVSGELLRRWLRFRWRMVPTDAQLNALIDAASQGEGHAGNLAHVTLRLFRMLRRNAGFQPASLEQLETLLREMHQQPAPISLVCDPADTASQPQASRKKWPPDAREESKWPPTVLADDQEPRLSARLRRILGLGGKRREKLRDTAR